MTSIEPAPAEPVEVTDETADEMRVRFPVLVIEGLDTSDGRWLAPGSLTPRALPLTLLAQPESSHGGDDPGPAIAVGRIDTIERVPGPDVVSARTGEPFPEGTFIWRGTGVISTSAEYKGQNIANMVRKQYLRGVSVDLVGMDYELLGEDGYADVDPEHPRRTLVTHAAEIGAATLVALAAFGDAYVELEGDTGPVEPPADLVASAAPAWRSSEVGDYETLPEDTTGPVATVEVPADAVAQIAKVIDTGEERDAGQLASDIVAHITTTWGSPVAPDAEEQADETAMADQPAPADAVEGEPSTPDETGMPDQPQECELGSEPATHSLIFAGGEMYVAICDEHDQDARDTIVAQGYEVEQEVPIPAEDAAEEMA